MRDANIMETVKEFMRGNHLMDDYELINGSFKYEHKNGCAYFVHAIHRVSKYGAIGSKNKLNVYWCLEDADKFTDREVGLMAASGILTMIHHKRSLEEVDAL